MEGVSTRPKAFLFDVFGTVVNWRFTVESHLVHLATTTLAARTVSPSLLDHVNQTSWPKFAEKWRKSYSVFTTSFFKSPGIQFKTIDQHHYDSLIELLEQEGLTGLWTDEELRELSRIWHFLVPWEDSAAGIGKLNDLGYETATLSNGNESLLSDLCAHGSLPFTHIISAEFFGTYKPSPTVYNGAAKRLKLEARECALVAAHLEDLRAARGVGMGTVYVGRKGEEDEERERKVREEGWVDVWIGAGEGGIEEVAVRFGRVDTP